MAQRKFMVLMRRQPGTGPMEEPSPEQMQKMYAAFNAWKDKYKDAILDMGSPLKPDGRVARTSGVVEGPYAESKEIIGGYMIVGGKDYDAAVRVASECPGVMSPGSSLEVRELASH